MHKEAFAWVLVCDLTLFAIDQLGIRGFTGLGIYLNYFGELLQPGYQKELCLYLRNRLKIEIMISEAKTVKFKTSSAYEIKDA